MRPRPLPLLWLAVLGARLTRVGRLVIHDRFSDSAGNGVDLILIPGLCLSGRYMLPAARLFSRFTSVLVPDLPGSGRSSCPASVLSTEELADVLGEWLDAVGVTRAVVLGNSYGAAVAVACALRRADRVVGTVLAGPTGDPGAHSSGRYALRLVLDLPHERPALWAIAGADYVRFGPLRAMQSLREMIRYPFEQALADLVVPTLVVRGHADPIAPATWLRRIAALLAQGELAEVPGGHAAHYTHPALFTTTVRRFLSSRGFSIDSGAQP
jgi:2-hydroxy-6-oxonona-2,4-dienedioate hydrolase